MDFAVGDIVTVGNGKTEYEITVDLDLVVHLKALVSGRAQRYIPKARLTHVARFKALRDAEEAEVSDEVVLEVPSTPAEERAAQVLSETPVKYEDNAEYRDTKNQHIEHIPGESPAAYQRRTGRKLDGRTTIYGRMILVGLQMKSHIAGNTEGKVKARKAAKRAAKALKGKA